MKKKTTLIIIGVIVVIAIVCAIIFLGSKKGESGSSVNPSDNINSQDSSSKSTKSDFWLGNVSIPSKTKELPDHLVDGIQAVPIDLTKLESGYTLNYSEYEISGRKDYKVNSISEVKGSNWDGSAKKIEIKNSNDEVVFTLNVKTSCGDKKFRTYEEAIEAKCWTISIDEDRLFNKKFEYKTVDGINEIMENIFNLLGKPTHIYIPEEDTLTVTKEDGIGQLSCIIVYEYGDFRLQVWMSDTYNKPYDFRMLTYYGLVYENVNSTNWTDEKFTKDIINQLV